MSAPQAPMSAPERLIHIYDEAALSHDGHRCMVAPSPEVNVQIKQELAAIRNSASAAIARSLEARIPTPPGFNDGLIYPGDSFPAGTPPRKVRSAAADRAPLQGTLRVIVVLVEFGDQKMKKKQKHFDDLFFSTGKVKNGSVKEYFLDVTNGLVDIVGEVVGPYTMPLSMAEYANGASGTGRALPNARTLARHAAEAANQDVNFAPYDNDGDGFVDAFIVLHAGPGAETTLNVDQIWSHKWVLSDGEINADGTKIYAYLTVPEDAKIGVCCHELGHLLFGFPDLYDTDASSEGVGNWCLMGGGSWNGGGDIPAHPSAWCKVNQGWVTVNNHQEEDTINISDVKTGRTVHRLWKNGAASTEYFLMENRQQSGYDAKLPGEGLLVWHIDESIEANSDEVHPKVRLVQADGKHDLEDGNNRGDAGDPFPGSSNNTIFGTETTPSSKAYNSAESYVRVSNIGPSGPVMTATIAVSPPVVSQPKSFLKEITDRGGKNFIKDLFKDKYEKEKDKEKFEKEKDKEMVEGAQPGVGFGQPAVGPFWGGQPGGGIPQPGGMGPLNALAALEARLIALETVVNAIVPFIDQSLRPDLCQGALAAEDDVQARGRQTQEGSADTKRLLDSKLPDA